LRNLGRIVLNNHAGAVRYPGAAAVPDLVAWERKTYGVTGAEVGTLLLEHWRFSPDTVAALPTDLVDIFLADTEFFFRYQRPVKSP